MYKKILVPLDGSKLAECTLNHVKPEDIVKAASLIRTGKVFALGIPLDREGPQNGLFGGRFNPIHQMLATGTDAIAGQQDWNKIRYADDTLMLCVQGATHWDALGHVFYEDKAYNGFDAKLIDSRGLSVLGIEHSKNKMVGRGVLLDIARFRGVKWMQDGESISNDELDRCAKDQNVSIGRGDFVLIRTGQMERCLEEKKWGGYAGGDAPGDEILQELMVVPVLQPRAVQLQQQRADDRIFDSADQYHGDLRIFVTASAIPKSATSACPPCTRMFSGLMSRCTIPCVCA